MTEKEAVRLNKFLADSGLCSRREADRIIASGRVTVDGEPAEMGVKVTSDNDVRVDGKKITVEDETILLIFNKPPGITCTTAEEDESNVVRFINYPKRIYPIGRLDKYSEGLLLLTNRGDLVNGIMRSRYEHEKEYVVTVDGPVTDEFLKGMAAGVPLPELNTVTKPCFTEKVARNKFRMIITQGLNRQIRRMCEHFGFRVMKLKRMRILDIELGNLKTGEYRKATDKEIQSILGRKDQ